MEDTEIEKEKIAEPENNKKEETEKNEEVTMVELQSEDNEKKAEVVGKASNNKEQATEEQTVNNNMVLSKDANIENTKSEAETKREDEQYGKLNHQCKIKEQKIKTKKKPTKQMNQKQNISNYIRKIQRTKKQNTS